MWTEGNKWQCFKRKCISAAVLWLEIWISISPTKWDHVDSKILFNSTEVWSIGKSVVDLMICPRPGVNPITSHRYNIVGSLESQPVDPRLINRKSVMIMASNGSLRWRRWPSLMSMKTDRMSPLLLPSCASPSFLVHHHFSANPY